MDWVLHDPERVLSKRHFAVAFRGGGWQIADTSVNGTYLNRDSDPIGAGDVRSLRDGDRLRVGAYEIEVRLVEDEPERLDGRGGSPFGDPFEMDPFAPARPRRNPFDEPDRPNLDAPSTSAQLPHDFDPLAPEANETPFHGPTQPDHSPVMEDAFRAPAPVGQVPLHSGGIIPGDDLLPDDWDKELLEGLGSTGTPPQTRTPPPPRQEPVRPPVTRRAEPKAPPPPVAEPEDEDPGPAPVRSPVRQAAPPPPEPTADDGALIAAFLRGAGLRDARMKDPAAAMLELGKAFRNLVTGLRAVLIARAAIKNEFGIEQTLIQARGNNPLKFSAGDDDALDALLGAGRRTDMAPHEAVAEALRDIRLHELASMAAMQVAMRSLLERLDPAKLRAQAEQGGAMALLPAQRKARAWDAYEVLYSRTHQALADDFDSVFGRAFARAYERALHEASLKEPQ